MKLPNIFESKATPRTFRAGETIFSAGEPAKCMYVVKAGKVDIVKGGRTLETIDIDGFFGELALVDQAERSAGAQAQTDCELVPIDEKQFLFMVAETPFFALRVMREMAARMRRSQA